jgi:hypothetical protein
MSASTSVHATPVTIMAHERHRTLSSAPEIARSHRD